MSSEAVLGLYRQSRHTLQITEKLNSGGKAIVRLEGATGSSPAFIAVSSIASAKAPLHLFILPGKEEAAYFYNDLQQLYGNDDTLFFPSSFKIPYQVEDTDNANILQRAEVLSAVLSRDKGKPFAVVTYPEALSEKVVTRSHLSQNTLTLKQGEKLSISFVVEVLAQYRFERKDFVTDPGQFSVRGGIIDVFSFSNDYPYRIEFFGEEVETIRSFDPVTQLSVDKHPFIRIIPNIEDKQIRETRQSFLEYIPGDSVIWSKETELCAERIRLEYESAEKLYAKVLEENSPIRHLPPADLFLTETQFTNQLESHLIVEFGQRPLFDAQVTMRYDIAPQPSFNKKFDLLFHTLKKQEQAGFSNVIFFDNEKQVERLHSIYEDIFPPKDGEAVHVPYAEERSGIHEGFIDRDLKLACFTDHQVFERYHRFRLKEVHYKKKEALTLKELKDLNPGDYITHIDHGIGRFGGLEKQEVNGKVQETIRLVYQDNDILYVSINSLHRISKYAGKEGAVPKIHKLGSNAWQNLKQKTKRKVKEIAFDLLRLYAKRKAQKGFAFSPDTYLQNELEASFIYEDTPDQLKATNDVKRDMESESPMDRLVCGDVGFGKTEIAIRAAFKAVCDSKQVAVLVPTTILALQHFKTFSDRLEGLPCSVDYLNRFKSAKEQKETLKKLAEGKIDILIGTHKLVGSEVKFKDLGLLIIDEEQKFGVGVKDKLKTLKANVDTLTLTATPIPRTLQFSMMGARDLSIINTPPPNRYPIHTEAHNFSEEIIRDAIRHEVGRGGQVFFIHNRVNDLMDVAGMVKRLCPDVHVGMGHGQMKGEQLESIMLDFIEGNYDVLVSTTIVESGLDISNANTIIINDAQNFGLSDLHQMRGRVGRTNKKAFCYLLVPSFLNLTDEARKRLTAIEQFSDLGSGFNIAMRDLDIRGAGNLLGAEQSGFITEIGYEMYQKILDEAMEELRDEMHQAGTIEDGVRKKVQPAHIGNQPFVKDCTVETDLEILIPDAYVNNITERLNLYRELDDCHSEEELQRFQAHLADRFGPPPGPALELIDTVRLRMLAERAGIEKLFLKNNRLSCYFVSNQQSPFYQSELFSSILQAVQKNPRLVNMRQKNDRLSMVFEHVRSIAEAKTALGKVIVL
jgi:transcription-repair coupling factor (superfamily II helicase)